MNTLQTSPTIDHIKTLFDQATVCIGQPEQINETALATLRSQAEQLKPWRKGPFNLFGIEIDAEWRSDLKFARIQTHLGSLKDKTILDIGCNNGYFMFRLLPYQPQVVVGIDPVAHCRKQFEFLQQFVQAKNLQYHSLGIENLGQLQQSFDVIFSMGIIYHHRHPLQQLQDMQALLEPGGQLILETLGIPGEAPYALFPENRYAQMRNTWFIPTLSCCINWLKRAKLVDIQVLDNSKLTPAEQRVTTWSTRQSLQDFLDPNDPNKTIEGYPAPRRFCLSAKRA